MTLFDLFRADRERQKARREWLCDRTDENYRKWRKAENEYTRLLRQDKREPPAGK